GSSMLSGFTATAILAYFYNQTSPTLAQNVSAGFIIIALGFLSPLHHFDRVLAQIKRFFGFAPPLPQSQRLFCLCAVAIPAVHRWPLQLRTPKSPRDWAFHLSHSKP